MSTREVLRSLYSIRSLSEARRQTSCLYRQAKAQREISLLHSQHDAASRSLSNALIEMFENRLAPEERVWVERIDALRKQLMTSAAQISFMDYGAGSSDLHLSDDEMYRGRVITKSVGEIVKNAGTRKGLSALLLFKLIREFKPLICLELGTNLGFSASYQAAALKLNGEGQLVTLEGAESVASLAKHNLKELGLNNVTVVIGRFQDTLGGLLNELGHIDYAFIDGHHDEKATLRYFEQIYPFLSKRAVVVFDDIEWSTGMTRAWKAMEADQRVAISADLWNWGVCIIDPEIKRKQKLDFSWDRRILESNSKLK